MSRKIVPISFIIAALALATSSAICGGVYHTSAHGSALSGVLRDSALPRGNCAQCHSQHGQPGNSFGLFADNYGGNKNALCFICHTSASGTYAGQGVYEVSVHNTSPFAWWPGSAPAARPASDFGNCANCHDPHGASDSFGLVPSLTVSREEGLCLACHDSSGPSTNDIKRQVTKLYDHAFDNSGLARRHSAHEAMIPSSYSSASRHVECADCHNVHRIGATGVHTPGTNAASDAIKGVSWVETTYGGSPGVPPAFAPRAGNYLTDIRYEYELCFKCHSSWAFSASPPSAPSGGVETDQSVEFNPNNASYHPVTAQIKNNSYTIPTAANGFVRTMESPWADISGHKLMSCSDCHASEIPNDPAGPHGSTKPYVLIASTSTSDNALCLKCHKASVYAPAEPGNAETGSRFDTQTTRSEASSHYKHVVDKRIGCRQCHGGSVNPGAGSISPGSTHGTNTVPGFMNGTLIVSYTPGSCQPTCHSRKTYTAGPE